MTTNITVATGHKAAEVTFFNPDTGDFTREELVVAPGTTTTFCIYDTQSVEINEVED